MSTSECFSFQAIGQVHSCYKEKFGIPRQPGLVKEARGAIEIFSPFDQDVAFRGLDAFSHFWVVFVFHQHLKTQWSPTVRPPRLGGNQRHGVFATRSPVRPNPIGLSLYSFEGMERREGKLMLNISGLDLLDQTPVIDIKPYVSYTDCKVNAVDGFVKDKPSAVLNVSFSERANVQLTQASIKNKDLGRLIRHTIELDPRPAYLAEKQTEKTLYAMRLLEFDIKWTVDQHQAEVIEISHS
ncbi:MAG: tRNA (N6-threonylcarbamoyladenosine(37)-N6)-methyltransferase TrmO [Gammaproteobacteria bacterium]|nr:tRNA (N6-threonylcarbamoyladenosine(37)-N6)-methyltransferase TrmO [Gammaproteobacteria bacterium]